MKTNFLSKILIFFIAFYQKKYFYKRAISKKTLTKIKNYKIILQYLLNRCNQHEVQHITKMEIQEIKKMIESFIESFQLLSRQKVINQRQEHMANLFTNLSKLMQEIKIKEKKNNALSFNINELIMKKSPMFLALLTDANIRLEFEYEKQGEMLLDVLIRLEVIFIFL